MNGHPVTVAHKLLFSVSDTSARTKPTLPGTAVNGK